MTEKHENLLAAYFANQITEEEKAEILSLLDTDGEFAARFREMEAAYIAACIPAFEKAKEKNYKTLAGRISPRRVVVSFWRPFAIAASIAAVICLGATLYTGYKYRDAENFLSQSDVTTITATRGSSIETTLPDGSRVCLNAASSLSFDRRFGRGSRDVTLDGEGYFKVASDAGNPFRVHSGNACVTVKGTVFNVRSYADENEISVSLLEGSVLLTAPSGEVTLTPGNCAIVSRADGKIRMEAADMAVADWTKGKIVFTDKSVPEILGDVERRYGVNFVYGKDLFQGERFTGNIASGLSIDEILSYIDVDHKYVWSRQDDTIEIHKK